SRRSVSSWVSPGPRRPIEPPRWRSRWVQPRTRRVAMCLSWASSTCSLPSWLRARWAKMSRIRPVRSTTRRSSAFSRLRSWPGVSGWFTSTRSAPVASHTALISSSLPLPTRVAGLGRSMRAVTTPARVAPAERASSENSSGSGSAGAPRAWGWISSACSPLRGRSNSWVGLGTRRLARSLEMEAAGPDFNRRVCRGSGGFGRRLPRAFGAGGLDHATARAHAHVAGRHHGGDGVLVDHLADGIAQQHDELVERLDHALQLDAVDQVDRHRHAFAPQRVQERILQGLPLGHGVSPAWL